MPKHKRINRRGKRNSIKHKEEIFCIIGVNANGITSKWNTFKRVVNKTKPLVWNIKEAKCIVEGGLKLNGYTVFEHVQSSQDGGRGLAMGCSEKLNPKLTRSGGDEVEAITVNINFRKIKISCTTAYGPQTDDKTEKKDNFWQYLDEEAKKAELEGEGFLLQGDLNSWLGSDIIQNDPRNLNNNEKRFNTFLTENSLTVVNALGICKGLITRIKMRDGKIQKSIIDFFVVCKRLRPYLKEMIIDDQKDKILTNYNGVNKGKKVAVDTDHMTMLLKMNLNIFPQRSQKIEMLDFKYKKGNKFLKFKELKQMISQTVLRTYQMCQFRVKIGSKL